MGAYLRASSGMYHASFRTPPGDCTLCLAPSLVLAGNARDSVGRRHGLARQGKYGPCKRGRKGAPACRARARRLPAGLGLAGGHGSWLGNPMESATTSHQAGPKQPHIQPPHLLGGGHLTASHGAAPVYKSPTFFPVQCAPAAEPSHCNELSGGSPPPCLAEGPCGHPLAVTSTRTSVWDCCQHCLDLTQNSQTCAPREPIPPARLYPAE